jgi:HNH endonuclease
MPAIVNLIGKCFGRLKVIGRAEENKRNKPAWICICECGNTVEIAGCELRQYETNSCGCLRKDKLRIDITGKRFGRLLAINITEKRGKSTAEFWLCKCDCGKDHVVSSQHLRNKQIRSCGCLKEENINFEKYKKKFFLNVEKTETCWLWKGSSQQNNGYGIFFAEKMLKAHRFSYLLLKRKIPKSKMLCHTCDNRLCVNPEHLYAGTAKDNARDMVKRGRARKPKK